MMLIDDLPACLAELGRLLSFRHPRWQHCFLGTSYTCGLSHGHRITMWEPGSEKEFAGKTFGDVYRAAYEYATEARLSSAHDREESTLEYF